MHRRKSEQNSLPHGLLDRNDSVTLVAELVLELDLLLQLQLSQLTQYDIIVRFWEIVGELVQFIQLQLVVLRLWADDAAVRWL